MKVTKFIKEYVQQEITKKFNDKVNSLHKDYWEERDELLSKIDAVVAEANEKAEKLISEAGFEYSSNRYGYSRLVTRGSANILKPDVEKAFSDERERLKEERYKAERDLLLTLELGVSSKEELTELLDSVMF